jgi:transcriptional regulator with XRE-family HTH domain
MDNRQFQEALGDRIRKIRLEKNMSQTLLASQCGIEKANLSRIESGQANPTVLTLLKISAALNVSVAEFFKYELTAQPVVVA